MKTIPEAQKENAALYREHARRAPWNSKTRQSWLKLAEEAEACATRHETPDRRNAFHIKRDFPGTQTRTYGLRNFYTCEVIMPDGETVKGLGTTLESAEDAAYYAVKITIRERLEYLRGEIEAERISYGEIVELESLAAYIDPADVQLLEAAGVPETF